MTAGTREIVAALRRHGVTEVDVSSRRRAEYSGDASLYRVVPAAVVFPRHADEIDAIRQACADTATPLVARGAGTSIAGNAIGTGVVMDVSRHLRRIHGIDAEARTAIVDPGVVLDDLQRAAAVHGLRFGPDPSTHDRCTVGGMLGNNACGSRALAYGRTADNVVELDVLTGAGERIVAGRRTRARDVPGAGAVPGAAGAAGTPGAADPAVSARTADGSASPALAALDAIVRADLALIRTEFGRFGRQISGYSLEHLLPENGADLARVLVGSEGTCAVTRRATLRLVRAPARTRLVLLGYSDMAAAAEAVPGLLPLRPTAVEGMDRRLVDVLARSRGAAGVPDLPPGDAWLFVEIGADTAAALVPLAARMIAEGDPMASRVVSVAADAQRLWRIREDAAGLAARPTAERRWHAGWEDAAVPPDALPAYLRDFDRLLRDHGLSGAPYGHFGSGCVHIRLDFDLRPGGGREARRREFLTEAARLVASYGGSLSGEHGDGRARSELLPLMYSPGALRAFEAVKAVFDPDDLLNPGVLVRPRPVDEDVRVPAGAQAVQVRGPRHALAFGYEGDGGDFARAVHRCTGVGRCRADGTGAGDVMCPSYLATRDEKDSTRGRARVLQELANGALPGGWNSAEVHDSLELCLSCKGCAADCPTGVDMATYKSEVLHQAYRGGLRPRSHYVLGRLPRWGRWAARVPRTANALMASPLARPAKWVAGVDRRRPLPRFAPESFRRWFTRRAAAGTGGDPVLLWVDTFTDLFAPEVGRAAVAVLENAGYSVRIPADPVCCGLTWITTGQLGTARRLLRESLAALAPHAAAGIPVVGLEPSCVAVFRGDAADLLGDDEARAGTGMRTLAELLARRDGWRPPDLTGRTVVAQPHCHHHAVMSWSADEELLTRSGATVRRVGGCCGLAGNFGAERGHYDISAAVAETALLPAVRDAGPDAVVLADGFSCRTQLHDLAGVRATHLAQLWSPDGSAAAAGR